MRKEECCDMRGMLSFLILFLLSRREMHGQEIADELEQRRGARPSPGTIYPALRSLKDAGFVKEKKEGKIIVYHLTKEGEKAFKTARQHFCRTFFDIM